MIALLALVAFEYNFATSPTVYAVDLGLDGFLPIIGGMEGKVDAKFKVSVTGGSKDADGNYKASNELTSFEIRLDDEKLPFTLDNVKQFFPKTTISYLPNGRVVKNDAPDLQLPVRLPGLDVKRLPETTYMPVEFPEGGYEIGKPFSYSKDFGDSKVFYTVTPERVEGNTLFVSLTMKQDFETLEDEAKSVTTKTEDAFWKVKTSTQGKGTATFDISAKALKEMKITADSTSVAKAVKGSEEENRKLKSTLRVVRDK